MGRGGNSGAPAPDRLLFGRRPVHSGPGDARARWKSERENWKNWNERRYLAEAEKLKSHALLDGLGHLYLVVSADINSDADSGWALGITLDPPGFATFEIQRGIYPDADSYQVGVGGTQYHTLDEMVNGECEIGNYDDERECRSDFHQEFLRMIDSGFPQVGPRGRRGA